MFQTFLVFCEDAMHGTAHIKEHTVGCLPEDIVESLNCFSFLDLTLYTVDIITAMNLFTNYSNSKYRRLQVFCMIFSSCGVMYWKTCSAIKRYPTFYKFVSFQADLWLTKYISQNVPKDCSTAGKYREEFGRRAIKLIV